MRVFRDRRGGSLKRLCSAAHRRAFWWALRRWGERAVAVGVLSLDQIRGGRSVSVDASPSRGLTRARVRHPAGGEAAESYALAEVPQFKAAVAEAATAALVKALPRIIAAALTGNTS